MTGHDFIGTPGQRLARAGLHEHSPVQSPTMKLLFCCNCQDVRKLADPGTQGATETRCWCGQSWGRYLDRLNAEYGGPDAMLLGISNPTFAAALREQRRLGDQADGRGRRFEAFVISNAAPSVTRKP